MTDLHTAQTPDPIAAAQEHLDRAEALVAELTDLNRDWPSGQISGGLAEAVTPLNLSVDPLWLSAIRGRIMAAVASAASLAASGTMLYQAVATFVHGPDAQGAADIAAQAMTVADAGLALAAAAASLIALLASLNSKAREWLRTRMS